MIRHNYEFLTLEENAMVNVLFNRLNNLTMKGLITKMEASFTFQDKIMKQFDSKQAFNICTNRHEFKMNDMNWLEVKARIKLAVTQTFKKYYI